MGLKIRDNQTSSSSEVRPRLPAQSHHPFYLSSSAAFDQREGPQFSSFGGAQNLRLGLLNHHSCLQSFPHRERTLHRAPSTGLAGNHYADSFSGEMSFGGLPVLEDDVLNAFLEPSPTGDRDRVPSMPQHQQTDTLSRASVMPCHPVSGVLPRDPSAKEVSNPISRSVGLSGAENDVGKRPSLVTQFPHKERLEGFDFKVSFPSDSPKLVVSMEGEHKRIHSVNDCLVAIFFNHSAGPQARVRFLVVFTNDGESTTPVHPCRNHQCSNHPAHIMEVSGVSEASWESTPHPSILVLPCETNGSLLSMNLISDKPTNEEPAHTQQMLPCSCAQLKFLCRNSCLTRKDLTLICQLERNQEVLARESFLLKVSACPRRDARARKNLSFVSDLKAKTKRRRTWEEDEVERPLKRLSLSTDEDDTEDRKEAWMANNGSLVAMVTEARSSAFSSAMSSAFESLHPDDFLREAKKFDLWWKAFLRPKVSDPHNKNSDPI